MNAETKTCLACGNTLKGRADKKYCNDYCRNHYNNQLNSDNSNCLRNVNNILRRNRRILEELLGKRAHPFTVLRTELEKKGFNFNFFTSTYTNKSNNKMYYYCYEYGYSLIEEESKCQLVHNILTELLQDMGKK
jgi:hypothetical protein